MPNKIVAYQTDDGVIFATLGEAERHEEIQRAVPLASSLKGWIEKANESKLASAAGLIMWIRKHENEIRFFFHKS